MGDQNKVVARLMSSIMKITGKISKTKTTVIMINQIRENWVIYSNPEVTTGVNALKFFSSQRVEVSKELS